MNALLLYTALLFPLPASVASDSLEAAQTRQKDVARVAALIDRHIAHEWKKNGVTPAPVADDAGTCVKKNYRFCCTP